jgi:hypothetical protein
LSSLEFWLLVGQVFLSIYSIGCQLDKTGAEVELARHVSIFRFLEISLFLLYGTLLLAMALSLRLLNLMKINNFNRSFRVIF